jgi:hypothetical protein
MWVRADSRRPVALRLARLLVHLWAVSVRAVRVMTVL